MSDANVGLLSGTTSSEYNEKTDTTYDKRDKNLDLLNKDRLQLLVKNKEEICEKISIKTEVIDVLINKSVITTEDRQLIKVRIYFLIDIVPQFVYLCKKNEMRCYLNGLKDEGGEGLIDIVKKKTDKVYEAFCDALHETNQTHIIHNFLVTESK